VSSACPSAKAAEGVVTVINANMANAIRSRTVQKGIDPRNYALVAFGGAGPLHGAEVAEMLGVPEVIVPPHPGITSAVGLLISDLRYDAIRTSFQVSVRPTSRASIRTSPPWRRSWPPASPPTASPCPR
jgi:N-methylhydantoinase A